MRAGWTPVPGPSGPSGRHRCRARLYLRDCGTDTGPPARSHGTRPRSPGGSRSRTPDAFDEGNDHIVVTAHRRQGLLGPQLGPVATTLLHHSHCPVLLVPETPQGSLPGPSHS
ncbi:universal stress protein [Streptomyces sp. SID13666]|uniref:universal stress protein n=1 Tax=unclassified Streptomyces TaxID=2593676 RepID=UPI0013C05A77|nr:MULTISPECIES: universal stress protein [unclassified Streptomyces]NEA54701.1 universal stress protein [Streptomyces sp. SID13666]NEA70490.1 universal stress protein [Streptomyces sp. SID13588]